MQDPAVHLDQMVDLEKLDLLDLRVPVDLLDHKAFLDHLELRDNLDRYGNNRLRKCTRNLGAKII